MRIPQAVIREFLPRPVIRFFQVVRAGQARADHVRKIFQIRHDLVVVVNLGQDFVVRLGIRIFHRRCGLVCLNRNPAAANSEYRGQSAYSHT